LALIPARSGSVRVPNKNIRNFCGENLVKISVKEALKAERVDYVGFSSDAPEYISIANSAGLSEKYLRPKELADANSSSIDCVKDYLDWFMKFHNTEISHLVLLQPTSPFRTAAVIDSCIKMWENSGKSSLISVGSQGTEAKYLVKQNHITGQIAKIPNEENETIYSIDGSIYITPLDMIYKSNKFWDENSALFITEYPRYFDIDTELDYSRATVLYQDGVAFDNIKN
jgi:CMP-N,N'-diacetyllegionaminic acid synthase